jgi:hypothetical protein
LGALAELRKAAISVVMFVHPSVRRSFCMEKLGYNEMDFHEILYFSVF